MRIGTLHTVSPLLGLHSKATPPLRWRGTVAGRASRGGATTARRGAQRCGWRAGTAYSRAGSSAGGAGGVQEGGPLSLVTFAAQRRVAFGQSLKVVGSTPVLGSWDSSSAPAMEWGEGDNWRLTVELPPGRHEFKLVVVGGQGGGPLEWEGGSNRLVEVPDPLAAANSNGAFRVMCEWSQTGAMLAQPPQGPLTSGDRILEGPEGIETDSDEGVAWVEDMAGEPAGAANDEGEPVVLREVQPTEEQEGPPSSAVAAINAARASDEQPEEGPEAAGTGASKPAVAAAKAGAQAAGEAAVGGLAGGPEPPRATAAAAPESLGGTAGSGAAAAGAAPTEAAGEPSTGTQLAAAALGLLALPVVAWSEYQLHATGCGLPPGPGGLLGAAEGVSYLVVGGLALWSLGRKIGTGRGLPAGPGGLLGAAEGGSWLAVATGLIVLAVQVQTRGYIPSALPDANCFGGPAAERALAPPEFPEQVKCQLARLREGVQGLPEQLTRPLQGLRDAAPELPGALRREADALRAKATSALSMTMALPGVVGQPSAAQQECSAAAAPAGPGSSAEAGSWECGSGDGGASSVALSAPGRQRPGDGVAHALGRAWQGLASLANPSAAASESAPPPLKPKFEAAVEALRKADVQPVVNTLERVFGDLREGFVGIAQTVLPPEQGEQEAAAEAQAPGAAGELGAASQAGAAPAPQPAAGRSRVGDSLREALDRADVGSKVLEPARELGKRTSALLSRAGDAAEALLRAPQEEDAQQAQQAQLPSAEAEVP